MSDDECKAEANPRPYVEPRGPRFPRLWGRWYRLRMRVGHRYGFCYPETSNVEPGAVWCHWCGMRGRKPVWEEAIAAKLAASSYPRSPQ